MMPAAWKRMADRAQGILLDTSAIIAHMRGRIDILALTTPAEPLFVPLVALGELYKGVEKSARSIQNRQCVDDFLQLAALLFPDSGTAEIYARAAVKMEACGQVIPENDLWIAAVALECDKPLSTLDAHFQRVYGLTVIQW